jgi:hypothetical protein
VEFTSYADKSNALWGTGFATSTLSWSNVSAVDSFSGKTWKDGFEPNGSTYSVTNKGVYTLSAGGALTLTGGATQVSTPAPSSLHAALLALPILGLYGWRRYRVLRPA